MRMLKYILKRIAIAIPVLLGITLLDFAMTCMAGSPLDALVGPRVSEDAVAAKEIALGLDQPFYVQYWIWLKQLLRGNLGYSMKSYQPVAQMIGEHIGPTLLLMGSAFLVSLLIGLPAGVYSATHQYTKRDYAVVTASFLGTAVPSFFLALLFIYVFNIRLNWLPSSGMTTLGGDGGIGDVLSHLIMPMLVLAFGMAGTNIRYIRSAVLEILGKDYLRTAKAKGIGKRKVTVRHALRNALVTVVTIFGMQLPMLLGGAVIVEQVFSWPGLGLMTMSAINARDYPVIMGVCLLSAVIVLLGNLLTDILYAVVDPTIRLDT